MVSDQNKSQNYLVCAMDINIGSSILYYNVGPKETNIHNLSVDKEEGPQTFRQSSYQMTKK